LTSQVTILQYQNTEDEVLLCQGLVRLGDGTDDLDGTGGEFELTLMFGSRTNQPDPQLVWFCTAVKATVFTEQFPLPIGETVTFKIKSPNAADSSVYVHACIYEVGVESIRDDLALLFADGRKVVNVYDETGTSGGEGSSVGVYPSTGASGTGVYPGAC